MLQGRCSDNYGVSGPLHTQPASQLRCQLLKYVISAFFQARAPDRPSPPTRIPGTPPHPTLQAIWATSGDHTNDLVAERMRLVVWDAPASTERAWLNVHSSSECLGLALAPLLPTRRDATDAAGIAAFVHHPEYAQLARRDNAEIAPEARAHTPAAGRCALSWRGWSRRSCHVSIDSHSRRKRRASQVRGRPTTWSSSRARSWSTMCSSIDRMHQFPHPNREG